MPSPAKKRPPEPAAECHENWTLTGLQVTDALRGVSVGPRPLVSFDPMSPSWQNVKVICPVGPYDPREIVLLEDGRTGQVYRFNTSQVSTVWKRQE